MIANPEVKELLEKAMEAERRAASETDQAQKADWQRIAQGYYELAESVAMTARIIAALEDPLPPEAFQPKINA
jgi:hypothetical protein